MLLFESIAERTSELEDAIDVDGQLLFAFLKSDLMGATSSWWARH